MPWTRPPRNLLCILSVLVLVLFVQGGLRAQTLILPDIVLPGAEGRVISLPVSRADIGREWYSGETTFRRIYPLSYESSETPWIFVDLTGSTVLGALEGVGENAAADAEPKNRADNAIRFSLMGDLAKGNAASIRLSGQDYGTFDLNIGMDYPLQPADRNYLDLGWTSPGPGYIRANLGGRNMISPSFIGQSRFIWLRGAEKPDSTYAQVLFHVDQSLAVFGSTGFQLVLPLDRGSWSTTIEGDVGGFVGNSASFDGMARGSIRVGSSLPKARLAISFGLDIAYHPSLNVYGAPRIAIGWRPTNRTSVFFESELIVDAVSTVYPDFSTNDIGISDFLPLRSLYRLGAEFFDSEIIRGDLAVTYSHGAFPVVETGTMTVEYDGRAGVSGRLEVALGTGYLSLSADAEISVYVSHLAWNTELALVGGILQPYVNFSSEDRFLNPGLPGLSKDRPIIGVGADWNLSDNLIIGLFTYTAVPWSDPSLRIQGIWSPK